MRREIGGRGFRGQVRFDAEGIAKRAESARDLALGQLGEHIRARSAAIAPMRGGALASSGEVESVAGKVTVRYGAAYAAIQHEHTEFHHPGGGRAKFLQAVAEDPATAQLAGQLLAEKLRGVL